MRYEVEVKVSNTAIHPTSESIKMSWEIDDKVSQSVRSIVDSLREVVEGVMKTEFSAEGEPHAFTTERRTGS